MIMFRAATLTLTSLVALFAGASMGNAAWKPDISIDRPELKFVMISRSSEQMQAFYEGRGFPADKVKEIASVCFLTTGVDNLTRDTLWMDLSQWEFRDRHGRVLEHRGREQWKQHWKQLGLKLAHISTFNWTVMPQERDLFPDEHIGSNITLVRTGKDMNPVTLTALFPLGKNKSGGPVIIKVENIQCLD